MCHFSSFSYNTTNYTITTHNTIQPERLPHFLHHCTRHLATITMNPKGRSSAHSIDPNWAHRALYHKFSHTADEWPAVEAVTVQQTFDSVLRLVNETPLAVEYAYPLWEMECPELAQHADRLIQLNVEKQMKRMKNKKRLQDLEALKTLESLQSTIRLYHSLSRPSGKSAREINSITDATFMQGTDGKTVMVQQGKIMSRSAPVAMDPLLLDYMEYADKLQKGSVSVSVSVAGAGDFGGDHEGKKPCPVQCRCVDCAGPYLHRDPESDAGVSIYTLPRDRPGQCGRRLQLNELRYTVGVGWMRAHSAPELSLESTTSVTDNTESFLNTPNILTNVLNFKYKLGPDVDVMTNDFTIGLFKWVKNGMNLYMCKYPDGSWVEFWKEWYENGIMFLIPMELHNRLVIILSKFHRDYPDFTDVSHFYSHGILEWSLVQLGMDPDELMRQRNVYLPDIDGFQYRLWEPQLESLWVSRLHYDVFKYEEYSLTGVTPVELWSEWCCGLWGQSSIREHEHTRYELYLHSKDNIEGPFELKCPFRLKIIEIIAYGVLKKGLHPQLIVDYLQGVMLINIQSDIVFLVRHWAAIVKNLYNRDVLEGVYGLSVEEMLRCDKFGDDMIRNVDHFSWEF